MTQDGAGPDGPARPPAGDGADRDAAALHPADLSVLLRAAVSGVGAGGPPPGGLARVRRKAKVRQRNRAVLAGTASVLVIVLGVSVATGGRISLVPSLTSVVGLGPGNSHPQSGSGQTGQNPAAAGETSHPVWPWTGPSAHATGPAIGPGAPATAPPASPGASPTPLCTSAMLGISTVLGVTAGDTRYGLIDVTPQTACVTSDPPMVEVTNAAGTAAASVQILTADHSGPPQLPVIGAGGTSMVLQAGQPYEFQFAWVAPGCPDPGSSPSAGSGDGAAGTAYSLHFAVPGSAAVPGVTLNAACGAQVYVTDVYQRGAYPTPTPTPTPAAPTTSNSTSAPPPPPPPPTDPGTPTDTSSPDASAAATDSPSDPQGAGKVTTVPVEPVGLSGSSDSDVN
ncbi:MAG TPA: hypothetical protein VGX23_35670 [Actinocrinis sp.]|nr:hypothetical protein [Actinocrinis sp.]